METVAEPFLVREGLIVRTPRGRSATASAWRHLGADPRRESSRPSRCRWTPDTFLRIGRGSAGSFFGAPGMLTRLGRVCRCAGSLPACLAARHAASVPVTKELSTDGQWLWRPGQHHPVPPSSRSSASCSSASASASARSRLCTRPLEVGDQVVTTSGLFGTIAAPTRRRSPSMWLPGALVLRPPRGRDEGPRRRRPHGPERGMTVALNPRTRGPRRVLLSFVALILALGAPRGRCPHLGHRGADPKLGLDLEGGTEMVLEPVLSDSNATVNQGQPRPGPRHHPAARRRQRRG